MRSTSRRVPHYAVPCVKCRTEPRARALPLRLTALTATGDTEWLPITCSATDTVHVLCHRHGSHHWQFQRIALSGNASRVTVITLLADETQPAQQRCSSMAAPNSAGIFSRSLQQLSGISAGSPSSSTSTGASSPSPPAASLAGAVSGAAAPPEPATPAKQTRSDVAGETRAKASPAHQAAVLPRPLP